MSDFRDRMAIESPLRQGQHERIAYSFLTTRWGVSPSSVSGKIYDVTAGMTDVTSTCMAGSPVVAGDSVTLPLVHGLTIGVTYRVEVKFTAGGNDFEVWFEIIAER